MACDSYAVCTAALTYILNYHHLETHTHENTLLVYSLSSLCLSHPLKLREENIQIPPIEIMQEAQFTHNIRRPLSKDDLLFLLQNIPAQLTMSGQSHPSCLPHCLLAQMQFASSKCCRFEEDTGYCICMGHPRCDTWTLNMQ